MPFLFEKANNQNGRENGSQIIKNLVDGFKPIGKKPSINGKNRTKTDLCRNFYLYMFSNPFLSVFVRFCPFSSV